jgi:hypothetical protein
MVNGGGHDSGRQRAPRRVTVRPVEVYRGQGEEEGGSELECKGNRSKELSVGFYREREEGERQGEGEVGNFKCH